MQMPIRIVRNRFGMKSVILFIALLAMVLGAWRFSRDQGPAHMYSRWLLENDDSRRFHAATELGAVTDETSLVVRMLSTALLSDRASVVRAQSARSLGRIVNKSQDGPAMAAATGALAHALSDTDPTVRMAAADMLGQIAPEPELVTAPLLQATHDGDERVRGAAIAALGLIQKKAWVDQREVRLAIIAAMNDPSLHVRELGLYAFWATAEVSPKFSPTLLRDRDPRTRRATVQALARSATLAKRVVPGLTASLEDDDADVRAGAARALENAGLDGGIASEKSDTP